MVTVLAGLLRNRPQVELALLFGSHARGTATADSDVDLAVLAPGSDLLELAATLGRDLGREVDVISLDDPGVPLLEELVRDAVVVHEGGAGAAASWRTRALVTLEIDRPWFARMRDSWLRTVAKKGLSW
jgi:predicted nucleotidyltransferase